MGRRVEDSLFPPGLAEKAQHRGRCIVGEGQSLCRRLVHDLQPGEFRGLEGVVQLDEEGVGVKSHLFSRKKL